MRLRNIPRAQSVLSQCAEVIKNETEHKGSCQEIFGNSHPIHIEIGMGKGKFLLSLASLHPEINYIGIERYSSVLLRAVEKFQDVAFGTEVSRNIRFLCMDAQDIADVFAPGEVSRIYLNFSDPWPKARHARRRLTSKEFFERYDQVLAEDGSVEFKTDNRLLFDFSVEQLGESSTFELASCTYDLHHDEFMSQGNIMTEYEEKFSSLGNPICKLIAKRKSPA